MKHRAGALDLARPEPGDPRVVDDDVEPAERVERFADHTPPVPVLADIEPAGDRVPADGARDARRGFGAQIRHHHPGPGYGERPRHRLPDPPPGPGDDRDLVCQCGHGGGYRVAADSHDPSPGLPQGGGAGAEPLRLRIMVRADAIGVRH